MVTDDGGEDVGGDVDGDASCDGNDEVMRMPALLMMAPVPAMVMAMAIEMLVTLAIVMTRWAVAIVVVVLEPLDLLCQLFYRVCQCNVWYSKFESLVFITLQVTFSLL